MPLTLENLKAALRYYAEVSAWEKQGAGFAKLVANVCRSKFPFRYQTLMVMMALILII